MPIRKNLAASRDPYRPWGGIRGLAVCSECGAVYGNKSWSVNKPPLPSTGRGARRVVCPACRKIKDRFPAGVITLRGPFLRAHKVEILHRVRNEESRARRVNPLERIILVNDNEDTVEIQTTTERFAQRIGRELKRAFKGQVSYRWPGEDKFVRVEWYRAA